MISTVDQMGVSDENKSMMLSILVRLLAFPSPPGLSGNTSVAASDIDSS